MSEVRKDESREEAGRRMQQEISRMSVEELADFFDNNSTAEMPLEEATEVEIERPELEQISIRLPKEDLEHIRRRAAKSGVGYTTLIRMILRDHLRSSLKR